MRWHTNADGVLSAGHGLGYIGGAFEDQGQRSRPKRFREIPRSLRDIACPLVKVSCSGEVDDLAAVCDRVLVLKHGRIAGEFTYPIDPDELLRAQFGTPEETSHVD